MTGKAQREIPAALAELKSKPIWICWKKGKIPIAADGTKTGTSENYAHTWVTFDEALSAKNQQHFSGIGFVIPVGYFFLDIDHRGKDDPFAKELLKRFGTYAETSISGQGIHLYGKCDLKKIPTTLEEQGKLALDKRYYTKNPSSKIELYIGGLTNRYAVFTDNPFNGADICDCTSAVLDTLNRYMLRAGATEYSNKESAEAQSNDPDSDWAVISDLRSQRNGDKFTALFDSGNWQSQGYTSQSEADAGLCAMIAFRTGPDPDAINRIFRQSALFREKWEREDYRRGTIQAGIRSCNGQFHKSVMPVPPFIRIKAGSGALQLVPQLLAKTIRDTIPYILVRDNGKQATLIYVYENGVYRFYSRDMMLGLIKAPVVQYSEELVSMQKINEAYNLLMTDLNYVGQEALNADEHCINFQNGLLQISPEELRLVPHTHEKLSTIQIPCDWDDQEKPTPAFDSFMSDLTGDNAQLKQLLLEVMGVIISNVPGWKTKKALFLVGPGDCGKSVLKSLVEKILGKGNYIGIDLQEIEARFGTGSIYGTRLAGSSDMSNMTVAELKTFKKITGGDSLFAEYKGLQPFEYTYTGVLWFCMNRLPRFGGDDGQWVYDRIIIVRCSNTIPKDRQDKDLISKLYAEREAIVHKAVRALQNVMKNGFRFSEPPCVAEEREAYKRENNSVIGFFEECMCCRSDETNKEPYTTSQIFRAYKAWCKDNNNGYAKTAKEFRDTLSIHLGRPYRELTIHGKSGTCYRDLTLTEAAVDQYLGGIIL